jgi:hypothetical protein
MSVGSPDWLPRSLTSDHPYVAASTGMTSGVELFPFFNEPALKYQSYQIQCQFLNGAAAANNYASLVIRFYDGSGGHGTGNVLWEDEIEINVGAILTFITDRIHGAEMSLTVTFPAGTFGVLWTLSNRVADRLHILEGPGSRDRTLQIRNQVVINAGATSPHQFVPLFHGPADIALDASGAVVGLWNFYFGSDPNIAFKIPFQQATSITEIILPCRPLHYTITNNDAAQRTFFTSVWARDN